MNTSTASSQPDWLTQARQVLALECEAVQAVSAAVGEEFARAVECILALEGRLVVVGMGKSGIIAQKIAATFASTGTPAQFVHAAEAQHGDLGMITRTDVVLALSHSGETEEVRGMLPAIKRLGVPLVGITGNPASSLAQHADIVLHVPVSKEACPMNLAPTASTTATLALGDALAVVVLGRHGFKSEDFARIHPAGSLGRRLKCVGDLMHRGRELPLVNADASLREAIVAMSRCRLGIAGVLTDGALGGCLTDGDLRRVLETGKADMEAPVKQVMHPRPRTISEDHLASEAVRIMEENKITVLFVTDAEGGLAGAIHLHDLLQAGVA